MNFYYKNGYFGWQDPLQRGLLAAEKMFRFIRRAPLTNRFLGVIWCHEHINSTP